MNFGNILNSVFICEYIDRILFFRVDAWVAVNEAWREQGWLGETEWTEDVLLKYNQGQPA